MDKISINRIYSLHPVIVQTTLDALTEINCALNGRAECRIQETLRSLETQKHYYALGRTKVNPDGKSAKKPMGNIITNAKPGQGYHPYGLALDFVLLVDGKQLKWDTTGDYDGDKKADWMEIVAIWKKHGFEWGGDWRTFKDLPHVQMTFGYSWQELLAMTNSKYFIKGTSYVNISRGVKFFQEKNGLVADGIAGPKTLNKLLYNGN